MTSIPANDPVAEGELHAEAEDMKPAAMKLAPEIASDATGKMAERFPPNNRAAGSHPHRHRSRKPAVIPPSHINVKVQKPSKRKHGEVDDCDTETRHQQQHAAAAAKSASPQGQAESNTTTDGSKRLKPSHDVSDDSETGSSDNDATSLFSAKDRNQVLLFSSLFTADIENQSVVSSAMVTAGGDSTIADDNDLSPEELEQKARTKRVITKAQAMYRKWKYNTIPP